MPIIHEKIPAGWYPDKISIILFIFPYFSDICLIQCRKVREIPWRSDIPGFYQWYCRQCRGIPVNRPFFGISGSPAFWQLSWLGAGLAISGAALQGNGSTIPLSLPQFLGITGGCCFWIVSCTPDDLQFFPQPE